MPKNCGPLVVLLHRLRLNIILMIAEFCKFRCELCNENVPIWLKDGDGNWRYWCLPCTLNFLPDDTCPSLHNCPSSVDGQEGTRNGDIAAIVDIATNAEFQW
jgi:hypothetical protein